MHETNFLQIHIPTDVVTWLMNTWRRRRLFW